MFQERSQQKSLEGGGGATVQLEKVEQRAYDEKSTIARKG